MEFNLKYQTEEIAFIEFNTGPTPIEPEILKTIQPPHFMDQKFAHKGVILSGQGPIWLYAYLVHFYHPVRWIGIHVPRLGGAIVTSRHTPEYQPGDLVPEIKWTANGK